MPGKNKNENAEGIAASVFNTAGREVGFSSPAKKPAAKARRKASRPNLKKELKQIYAADEGGPVDMSFFERRPRRTKIKVFFSLIFFFALLSGAAWLGFFLFSPGQKFSEEKIKLLLEAPSTAAAGSQVTIKINYHNNQRVPLGEADLILRYPHGFRVSKTEPLAFNKENTEWQLGTLVQDKPGAITITGLVAGNKDDLLSFRVFLNYKPANFNAEFQKILTHEMRLGAIPLEASFAGPTELESGQTGDYEITYKNPLQEIQNNLAVKLSVPLGFKINSMAPSPQIAAQKTNEAEILTFGPLSIKPREDFKIKISGLFTAEAAGGGKNFTSELFLKKEGQTYAQGLISKNTELKAAAVNLTLTANNSSEKQTVNFEDRINFAISYENTGQLAIKNAGLRLVLETPSVENKSALNWSALTDSKNGAVDGKQITGNTRIGTITWTKKEIRGLAELKPGDKGIIEVTLPLKAKKDFDTSRLTNWHIKAFAELLPEETSGARIIQTKNLDLVLVTDLSLLTRASLKESGKNLSTYLINWTLTNTLHEITGVALTAALGEAAEWNGKVSVPAGELSFDKNTRQITWTINRIPVSFPKTEISFAVTLRNREGTKQNEALLIEKARVEATDKVTGEQILFWKEPLLIQ